MTPAAGALLGLLGSGVNLLRQAGAAKPSVEGASFDDLLSMARSGTLREGEPIRVGNGVELTPDQLERLGAAAAELEKAGAQRGVIMIDGKAIEYEVATRTVVRELDPTETSALSGIDAFVRAPDEAGDGVIRTPAFARGASASLLRALGEHGAA